MEKVIDDYRRLGEIPPHRVIIADIRQGIFGCVVPHKFVQFVPVRFIPERVYFVIQSVQLRVLVANPAKYTFFVVPSEIQILQSHQIADFFCTVKYWRNVSNAREYRRYEARSSAFSVVKSLHS